MMQDAAFVTIVERNLSYFTAEIAAANGSAGEFLRSERENIFDAVKYAARLPQTNYAAAKLLTNIAHLIEQNDSPSQWSQVFIKVLNRYKHDDSSAICDLYNRLGKFSRQAGEYNRSLKIYKKSLKIANQHQNYFAMANAEYGLSMNYFRLADLQQTEERILAANQVLLSVLYEDSKTLEIQGKIRNIQGLIALNRGDFDIAKEYFEEAVTLIERTDDSHYVGLILLNKAQLLSEQGEFERAVTINQRVIDQFEASGDWLSWCDAKIALANLLAWQDNWEEALNLYNSVSVHELRKRGHHKRCAFLHNNLGNAFYHLRNGNAAQRHLEEAIAIHRDFDPSPDLAAAIAMLAVTYATFGDKRKVRANVEEAKNLLTHFQHTLFIEDIRADIKKAEKKLQQYKRTQRRKKLLSRNY